MRTFGSRPRWFAGAGNVLPRLMARIPAPIHTKLLVGMLVICGALVGLAVVGLLELGAANNRAEELGRLEQKVAAYRQLQTSMTRQLFLGASAFSAPDQESLETLRRQVRQSGYNYDRLVYVTRDESEILAGIQEDYEEFAAAMVSVIELVMAGDREAALDIHVRVATPLAESLERGTDALVNRTESDAVALIDENRDGYFGSRRAVVAVAAGSLVLALVLGHAIAFSVITPVRRMDAHLQTVASGDFSRHIEIDNRDELGVLAANLNAMNDELGRLYRELEAASRHKSQFLANMSHELRTPLNAVIGFSEVLSEHMFGDLNERQDEYVADILGSGRHLLALINDILDLSKVEAGRMDLEVEPFLVEDVLASGVAMVRERASRNGISVELVAGPPVGLFDGDERKVKQVVFNLLTNAVKFTPPGGSVSVSAVERDGEVRIAVRDSGIGIAPEDQALIFDEFRQATQNRAAKEQEGTGLGLALARKFVEMHGGRIWVESAPGEGSTFTFTLPRPSVELPLAADPAPKHLTAFPAPGVARIEEAHGR